ncbi:DUF2304 domain-containing protein [Pseudactinotalea sp.]|uniref:DUF2304 domain-containing protein n=1 Tax=Pseudactinotalea sp. TaxID=1926260 RepID=UPI003B3B10A9
MDIQNQQLVIKILLLIGVAVATVLLTRSSSGARHQAIRRVLLVVFALVAAVVIVQPSLFSGLARLVGVGRGTDLLLYALAVAFACFLASYYGRQRALNRQITELTRALALAEGRREEAP